ncbi:MAG: hypothetical protein LBD94_01290, partial [Rickettsiales bacterium]|nr:hypothetical protein [Rickettsiales bacterium]
MNKFFAITFLLFASSAFAEVMPVYEEEIIEEVEEIVEPEQKSVAPIQVVEPATSTMRAAQNLRTVGRQAAGNTPTSRAVGTRSAATQTGRGQSTTGTSNSSRPVSSRTVTVANRATVQSRATSRSRTLANSIADTAAPTTREAAGSERTVQARAGNLYNSARVGLAGTAITSGLRGTSTVSARVGTSGTTTSLFNSTTTATSGISAEELAAQTDFCKAQYVSCMDNFCNVLDDNQGRCTCSSNITKYEKTEAALKQATIDLQDVATKIKYLGLSKDEVKSLFTMTAAEEALRGTSDTSELKSNLDGIQKLLIDPSSGAITSGSVLSLDMNSFDFNNGFDLNSFMNNGTSIGNQRGAALFDTAKARCASVITECRKQGVDSNMLTANYDLEIDKQCIAYERALTDSNDQMKTTIRNATTVLQQARLMVAQNKNKYDMKGCVNALDACMVDDFVCGDDYKNCLDMTGQYIVSGEIVVGSEPKTDNIKNNWAYGSSNAFYGASDDSLTEMIESLFKDNSSDKNLASFLNDKIGYIESNTDRIVGRCSNILNQCQNYTFEDGKYKEGNLVIKEYLLRTLT